MRVPTLPTLDRPATRARTIGILSTYPPTPCGLATFSAALGNGLASGGAEVRIVRVADGSATDSDRVIGELVNGSPASASAGARILNRCDAAIVQHEYGLYGGSDGDDILDVLGALEVPCIVVAHTVVREPTPHQRAVLDAVAALADVVVVMSEGARERLLELFDVDAMKVTMITHGAATPIGSFPPRGADRATLLTWGLIGPGKGIERVIDAMRSLRRLRARPRYIVAGQTHPKVLAIHGEAYRNARLEQAWRNGVASSVTFDADYRDLPSLTALIQSATAVVLPYDSTDQVTSGVLVDAIAAGRPVVATAFPHAVELLSSGAGIVVDHEDPDAMELALQRVITEPARTAAMAAEASRLAPTMGWGVVAAAYQELADGLLIRRAALV